MSVIISFKPRFPACRKGHSEALPSCRKSHLPAEQRCDMMQPPESILGSILAGQVRVAITLQARRNTALVIVQVQRWQRILSFVRRCKGCPTLLTQQEEAEAYELMDTVDQGRQMSQLHLLTSTMSQSSPSSTRSSSCPANQTSNIQFSNNVLRMSPATLCSLGVA